MAQDEAEKFFEQGNRLYAEGKYEEALSAYDKALAIDPKLADAWTIRGLALGLLRRYPEAVASYDKALAINPKYAAVWNTRGLALHNLGRHQEAVENFEQALECNPDLRQARQGKARALGQLEAWLKERRPARPVSELREVISQIEDGLHSFIQKRLQKAYGNEEKEWWVKGVPPDIRKDCAARREEDGQRRPLYYYTYFIDLRKIMDKQWRCFEDNFKQVKGEVKSKNEFLTCLARLNELRDSVSHVRPEEPSQEDLKFARHMRGVIENFTSPG